MRTAGILILLLLAILAMGALSGIAMIGSSAASDSCGGCDATPLWAKVGGEAFLPLLAAWLVYVVVLAWRRRARFAKRFAKLS